MIEQVGGFVVQFVEVAGPAGKGCFQAFFADLLGDFGNTLMHQAGGVAVGRGGLGALSDDVGQVGHEADTGGSLKPEAGGGLGVAGRTLRAGEDEQGVFVAVGKDVVEDQDVAGGFTLAPQAVF